MQQKKDAIMVIIFWNFLIIYQISHSPQAKQSVIIGNKNGTYELLTICKQLKT